MKMLGYVFSTILQLLLIVLLCMLKVIMYIGAIPYEICARLIAGPVIEVTIGGLAIDDDASYLEAVRSARRCGLTMLSGVRDSDGHASVARIRGRLRRRAFRRLAGRPDLIEIVAWRQRTWRETAADHSRLLIPFGSPV